MITGFKSKALKNLFNHDDQKGLNSTLVRRLKIILVDLETAQSIDDLTRPSFRLHELKGQRRGTWSVTVNGPWRVTFKFKDGDIFDVDLEQYH